MRPIEITGTVSNVLGGQTVDTDIAIPANSVDLLWIELVPTEPGQPAVEKDTQLDYLISTQAAGGGREDWLLEGSSGKVQDPAKVDSAGQVLPASGHGLLVAYDDEDAGQELHLRVINPGGDTVDVVYTIRLQVPVLADSFGLVGVGTETPTAQLEVESDSASRTGLIVGMPASPTVEAAVFKKAGVTRFTLIDDALEHLAARAVPFDNGTGAGPAIEVARNTNGATPAAGHFRMVSKDNSFHRLWVDGAGDLRIWSGGNPDNANDASGAVVGAQTSWHEAKEPAGDPPAPAEALEALLATRIEAWRYGSGGGERFVSPVIYERDAGQWFAKNCGENQTPALDTASGIGYIVQALKEIERRLSRLEEDD